MDSKVRQAHPIDSKRFCWIVFTLLLAGCTSFDQSDDGDSKSVLLGKTFTITLPALAEERRPHVEKENFVRFLEVQRDSPRGMDTFEFKAIGVGETAIHIPQTISSSEETKDFILNLKVVLGGSPY
jgi:paraquat-inducible protein B